MTIKIGINGFGRIGRNVLRQIIEREDTAEFEITGINDLTSAETLAHLLKYDSIHGILPYEVRTEGDNTLVVKDRSIKVSAERDPKNLGWGASSTDVVMECTGIFRSKEQAGLHIKAGAKKVLVSAPSPDPDITIVYGVNHGDYSKDDHNVVSCASCTTNCLAPAAKVILENFGIVRGTMTTVHSYTNDQRILDLPHSDMRRARAAAMSMIPTTTGAAKALALVIPSLKGKVDGFAIRVPTPNVSLVDFVVETEKEVTVTAVNDALKAAAEGPLKGVLGFCELPLVSTDYIGNSNSSTIDAALTMTIEGKLLKVVTWYDNEMGFSTRMGDVAKLMAG